MGKKGFTLIELLIVISIISLLLSVGIMALLAAEKKARDTKRLSDIKSLQTALQLYHYEYKVYPKTDLWTSLNTLLISGPEPYLKSMPNTPLSSIPEEYYGYAVSTIGDAYCLFTNIEKENSVWEGQDVDVQDCDINNPLVATSYDDAKIKALPCDEVDYGFPICIHG